MCHYTQSRIFLFTLSLDFLAVIDNIYLNTGRIYIYIHTYAVDTGV